MRQVIAVCRSKKKARRDAASVLDRYFWRVGDRTWRGTASNACLQRVSSDLRKKASRATAVAVFEITRSARSREPLFIVGSKRRFSADGVVPISVRAAPAGATGNRTLGEEVLRSAVRIAALFHDLGKATGLFQQKLQKAMKKAMKKEEPLADSIRHEVFSAFVFDAFSAGLNERALLKKMTASDAELTACLDRCCEQAGQRCAMHLRDRRQKLSLTTIDSNSASLASAVISLILTHHRLADSPGEVSDLTFDDGQHVRRDHPSAPGNFHIAKGEPPWRDERWLGALRREAHWLLSRFDSKTRLRPFDGLAQFGRTALMLADHLGSASKRPSEPTSDAMLANTKRNEAGESVPADGLITHTNRVYHETRRALDALLHRREGYPGLSLRGAPRFITAPEPALAPFAWQDVAAEATARLAGSGEGGFFACLMAGTGTGKTRAAPRVLAAAAFNDVNPARRRLRYNLGLGLIALARQSGREYVEDLGFAPGHVATLAGGETMNWNLEPETDATEVSGSEDRRGTLDGLWVEHPETIAPEDGEETPEWLASLSADFDAGLPAFIDRVIEADRNPRAFRRLVATPILSATIDHFMPAADARRSWHLAAMVRTLTADLIIDEVDLFEDEDIAAICRLGYLAGVGGRRVVAMSATMPKDVALALYKAYSAGYAVHARLFGRRNHVHALVSGDEPSTIHTNEDGGDFAALYAKTRGEIITQLCARPALRMGELIPIEKNWQDLCARIGASCARMHDRHAWTHEGQRISVGLIRMTRINHVAALALRLAQAESDTGAPFQKLICLHSQLPFAARNRIETLLAAALKRKGTEPNAGVVKFLDQQEVFAEAGTGRDISLIVIASPVIETGNDLDFDYAIVDPSSPRALVQTAGRVNRHRAQPVDAPNVGVLSQAVHALANGKLSKPGVETTPATATGLGADRIEINGSRAFIDLVGELVLEKIDARPALREPREGSLQDLERKRRSLFLHKAPSIDDFVLRPLLQFSTRHPLARKFRRQDDEMVAVFPQWQGAKEAWSWRSAHDRRVHGVGLCSGVEDVPAKRFLLAFDLDDLARDAGIEPKELQEKADRLLSVSLRYRVVEGKKGGGAKEARWFSPELGLITVSCEGLKDPFK